MITYSRQQIDGSDIDAVVEVLRSDFLTTGPFVEKFEEALCRQTGARFAVACSNGTAALHLACLALEVGGGDLGVTAPITFLASANCVEFCGGRTDFVDIDPERICLSPLKLEEYCRAKCVPKVVIPVDYAGVPADLPAIKALSEKFGFKIIEDAAHSIGSYYEVNGKQYACGSCVHSDVATFSFHPVKNITTGEGGAITTNDQALACRLQKLRSHGMVKSNLSRQDGPWYYEMPEIGFNYRITDFQCALGVAQLARLADFKVARQALARRYRELLKSKAEIILPPWPENSDPCFHLFPIRFKKGPESRRAAYDRLDNAGFRAQVHYFPVHLQPYYQKKYPYRAGYCPQSELFYDQCLSLPLFPGLTLQMQESIVKLLA
jgi:UDP-4-amino-4,6-dideoxy-N-acetyl-beta-L-altrosamine transaminase